VADFERWRVALEQDGTQPATTTKLIRKLERELARKERPLAEAAALLVLKKRWRERTPDEVDDNRRAEPELILTAIAPAQSGGFFVQLCTGLFRKRLRLATFILP
jgi:hypothetical protein